MSYGYDALDRKVSREELTFHPYVPNGTQPDDTQQTEPPTPAQGEPGSGKGKQGINHGKSDCHNNNGKGHGNGNDNGKANSNDKANGNGNGNGNAYAYGKNKDRGNGLPLDHPGQGNAYWLYKQIGEDGVTTYLKRNIEKTRYLYQGLSNVLHKEYSDKGSPYGEYNKAYDVLLLAANIEVDGAKRAQMLVEAEKLLLDDMAVAPLYFRSRIYLKNQQVKGMFFAILWF